MFIIHYTSYEGLNYPNIYNNYGNLATRMVEERRQILIRRTETNHVQVLLYVRRGAELREGCN